MQDSAYSNADGTPTPIAVRVEIFDPPMCCPTGLCGPTMDPVLLDIYEAVLKIKAEYDGRAVIERYVLGHGMPWSAASAFIGERCMALPVIVVENEIADKLVPLLVKYASAINLGKAYDKKTGMGPVVNQGHKEFVLNWIETAIKEGTKLILDGRNPDVPAGCEKGYYIGPTILDHVTEEMSCGREEIFGPVLCIKRVDNFEEGLRS